MSDMPVNWNTISIVRLALEFLSHDPPGAQDNSVSGDPQHTDLVPGDTDDALGYPVPSC
jgi:hypothetical protein